MTRYALRRGLLAAILISAIPELTWWLRRAHTVLRMGKLAPKTVKTKAEEDLKEATLEAIRKAGYTVRKVYRIYDDNTVLFRGRFKKPGIPNDQEDACYTAEIRDGGAFVYHGWE